MNKNEREKLRTLALAATPGEWTVNGGDDLDMGDERVYIGDVENAAYIAAANPVTLLALLDRIDELEGAAEPAAWLVEHDDYPTGVEPPDETHTPEMMEKDAAKGWRLTPLYAAPPAPAEPVAWFHENPLRADAISDHIKSPLVEGDSSPGGIHRPMDEGDKYSIPLYRHPPSAVPEWIPVWERMPEELKYTHALITLDNGDNQWVVADRYDGYSKSWENHYDPSGTVCVTHWMPLPAAPQGDSHHE